MSARGRSLDSITFILDTGATSHIVNNLDYLVNVRTLSRPQHITCANKADVSVDTIGDVIVRDDGNSLGRIRDVLFFPDLVANLFSLSKFMNTFDREVKSEFGKNKIKLIDTSQNRVIKEGIFLTVNFGCLNSLYRFAT